MLNGCASNYYSAVHNFKVTTAYRRLGAIIYTHKLKSFMTQLSYLSTDSVKTRTALRWIQAEKA